MLIFSYLLPDSTSSVCLGDFVNVIMKQEPLESVSYVEIYVSSLVLCYKN